VQPEKIFRKARDGRNRRAEEIRPMKPCEIRFFSTGWEGSYDEPTNKERHLGVGR